MAKTQRERRLEEYAQGRDLIIAAKSVPCADCKELFPWYCMDFDHVRGTKLFNIGASRRQGRLKTLAEIAKCDVVCAVCHRIREFSMGHWRNGSALPLHGRRGGSSPSWPTNEEATE